MKKFATTAATFAALTIGTATNAHVPDQCSDWLNGAEEVLQLRFQSAIRFSVSEDMSDANHAFDDALALLDRSLDGSRTRDYEEAHNVMFRIASAFQEAAISYRNAATGLGEELDLSAKTNIILLRLLRCIQSH